MVVHAIEGASVICLKVEGAKISLEGGYTRESAIVVNMIPTLIIDDLLQVACILRKYIYIYELIL